MSEPSIPPVPGGDPAARFRRPPPPAAAQKAAAPGGAPAPAVPPGPTAPPSPYGLAHMLEDSLIAPFRASAVFAGLAGRPAPGYGLMLANLLAFCALAYAANFMRSAAVMPELMRYRPAMLALMAAAALLLSVPLSFLAAAVLHLFMLLGGGAGGFARSYQAASLLAPVLLLQAMLNWFDRLWPVPTLLAAYLAFAAARHLHRAPAARAAAVLCLLAAGSLGFQWTAREVMPRVARSARDLQQGAAAAQELGRQMRQLQRIYAPGNQGPAAPPDAAGWPAPTAGRGAQPASGLDLVTTRPGQTPSPEQIRAMQQAGAGMLQPIMGMLNNPMLAKTMSPEQAKQFQEIAGMVSRMQESMASGKRLTPQEQAAMTQRLQAIMLQAMSQPQRGARPATAPPPPSGDAGR